MGNVIGVGIVWFIIEMLIWYLIAQFVSGWWVFGWFILAAVIGVSLIKKGVGILKPMAGQAQMAMLNPNLRPSENTVVRAIAFSIAGILFALPGVLSDIVAVILLLPPVQAKIKTMAKDYATKNPEKLMQMMASRMGGMGGIDPSMMAGMGGLGGLNGMMGQNPFGQNPFAQSSTAQATSKRKAGMTIDGSAKTIKPNPKTLTQSANDD